MTTPTQQQLQQQQEFIPVFEALSRAHDRLVLNPFSARIERRTFTSHLFLSTRAPPAAAAATATPAPPPQRPFEGKLPDTYKTLYFELAPSTAVADSFQDWRPYARAVSQISLDYRRSKSAGRPPLLWLDNALLRQATSSLLPAQDITWTLSHKDSPVTTTLYYDASFDTLSEKDAMLEFRCGRYPTADSLVKDFLFDKAGKVERVESCSLLWDLFYLDKKHEACNVTRDVVEKEARNVADLMMHKRRACRVHMAKPLAGWVILTDGGECDVELNFTVTVTDLVVVEPLIATKK